MIAYGQTGLPETNYVRLLVSDQRRRGVGYISSPSESDAPIGTVFFGEYQWGPKCTLTYAITARHCIEGLEAPILIEFQAKANGTPRKIETDPSEWLRSDKTDVACRLMKSGEPLVHGTDLHIGAYEFRERDRVAPPRNTFSG